MSNIENFIINFIIASPAGAYLIVLLTMLVILYVGLSIYQKVSTYPYRSMSLVDINPFIKLG